MVYRWYITIVKGIIIPLQLGGAPPCMVYKPTFTSLGNSGSATKRYQRAVAASTHVDWFQCWFQSGFTHGEFPIGIYPIGDFRSHGGFLLSDGILVGGEWLPWMLFSQKYSQMLHGAGIFTYIETPKITQWCR